MGFHLLHQRASMGSATLPLFALLLCFAAEAVRQEDGTGDVAEARDAALAALDKPLEKMRVKELLALLRERGVGCKACKGAEKAYLIEKVRESIHLPVLPSHHEEPTGDKDESVDDVLAKLKGMPGMENIKVFGREDIERMSKDGFQDL